jgi:hypothetical protein
MPKREARPRRNPHGFLAVSRAVEAVSESTGVTAPVDTNDLLVAVEELLRVLEPFRVALTDEKRSDLNGKEFSPKE